MVVESLIAGKFTDYKRNEQIFFKIGSRWRQKKQHGFPDFLNKWVN
jgi:hypothetical protein